MPAARPEEKASNKQSAPPALRGWLKIKFGPSPASPPRTGPRACLNEFLAFLNPKPYLFLFLWPRSLLGPGICQPGAPDPEATQGRRKKAKSRQRVAGLGSSLYPADARFCEPCKAHWSCLQTCKPLQTPVPTWLTQTATLKSHVIRDFLTKTRGPLLRPRLPGLLLPVQRPYVHPDASLTEKSIHHLIQMLALLSAVI